MNDSVSNIRTYLNTLPQTPVVYKWWFKEIPQAVSCHSQINLNAIDKRVFDRTTYYALYVGIGVDCRMRFKWHINQKHTQSNVKAGVLSTLRQTLSALLGIDMTQSEQAVNDYINKNCLIEWQTYPNYTKVQLENIETQTIKNGYYPLNIVKNRTMDKSWLKDLKALRKNYKK